MINCWIFYTETIGSLPMLADRKGDKTNRIYHGVVLPKSVSKNLKYFSLKLPSIL